MKTSSVSKFQRGYEYQVSLRTFNNNGTTENILRCKLPHLAATAYPEVAGYDALTFSVCDAFFAHSPGDADDSSVVDEEDVDNVLENWGSMACMKYGDANRDGSVNAADLEEAELYYTFE